MKRSLLLLLLPVLAYSGCAKKSYDPRDVPYFHFISVTFPDLYQSATLTGDTALFTLPYGTAITAIKTQIKISPSVTSSVPLNGNYDYTQPIAVILQRGNTSITQYIKVKFGGAPDTALLGVWIAASGGSPTLLSAASIDAMIATVDAAGFNTLFVDVFNQSKTLYPSALLQSTLPVGTQTQIVPGFDGLQYLITKAHAKNMKVIPWFEYGFISAYTNAGPILAAHPDWAGIDYKGNTTMRGNFYWLNGFKPEVQQFFTSLVTECVNNYDIDGIQLDDHSPAMPLNSGYDAATAAAYKTASGNIAPLDSANATWVQWREDQLTAYLGRFYAAIKLAKPKCIVCLAPAPGFGAGSLAQNNLQDYAAWVKNGFYDVMSPLQYQSSFTSYQNVINADLNKFINNSTNNPVGRANNRYFPGIDVTNSGSTQTGSTLTFQCLQFNRSMGIKGEVVWYYDGLGTGASLSAFKSLYPQLPLKAIFPNL